MKPLSMHGMDKFKPIPFENMATRKATKGELYIYQRIGPEYWGSTVGATTVVEQLKKLDGVKELDIHINSPGGQAWEGITIYNELARFPAKKTVYIDGLAASIASVIAMAGDEIAIAPSAQMMVHDAWIEVEGNADELRKVIERLDTLNVNMRAVYSKRTKQPEEKIQQLMSTTTYMTAPEAVSLGFADRIVEPVAMASAELTRTLPRMTPIQIARLRSQLAAQQSK